MSASVTGGDVEEFLIFLETIQASKIIFVSICKSLHQNTLSSHYPNRKVTILVCLYLLS